MVLTGISPVFAGTPAERPPVGVLPAVVSTPAPPVVGTFPKGSFANVPGPVFSGDSDSDQVSIAPKPIPSEPELSSYPVASRDEFSTSYELSDGRQVTSIGMTPQNVLVQGDWAPVSNRIARSDSGWGVVVHPLAPKFGLRASDQMSVSNSKYTLSWRLIGGNDHDNFRSVGSHALLY